MGVLKVKVGGKQSRHILLKGKEGYVLFNDALNTFYLTMHSTHFISGYMASYIRTTKIAREETLCHHMGYSLRLAARVFICIIPQTG